MIIGPAPIMRMVEMSVRLGIGSFALARAAGRAVAANVTHKKGRAAVGRETPSGLRGRSRRFRVKPLARELALKPRYTKIASRERVGHDDGALELVANPRADLRQTRIDMGA